MDGEGGGGGSQRLQDEEIQRCLSFLDPAVALSEEKVELALRVSSNLAASGMNDP